MCFRLVSEYLSPLTRVPHPIQPIEAGRLSRELPMVSSPPPPALIFPCRTLTPGSCPWRGGRDVCCHQISSRRNSPSSLPALFLLHFRLRPHGIALALGIFPAPASLVPPMEVMLHTQTHTIHTCTYTHATHTHMHTHMYTHTHIYKCTHIHTCTHTIIHITYHVSIHVTYALY